MVRKEERESLMFEQEIRATFGMHLRILATFAGYEETFEIYADHRSLTGHIPYEDVHFLSFEEQPVGADTNFWILSCILCLFVPFLGCLAFPLVYVLRKETVLAVTCDKIYFTLHGSSFEQMAICHFLEEKTGRNLLEGESRARRPSFSDKPTAYRSIGEAVPSSKAVGQLAHCPACGFSIEPDDDFCSNCGTRL
jgi:hypothetical protein